MAQYRFLSQLQTGHVTQRPCFCRFGGNDGCGRSPRHSQRFDNMVLLQLTAKQRAGQPSPIDDKNGQALCHASLPPHRRARQLRACGKGSWRVTRSLEPPGQAVGKSLLLRDLLIADLGIGTVPDFILKEPETLGSLVRILPDRERPAPDIFAVTASRLRNEAKVTEFIDHPCAALQP